MHQINSVTSTEVIGSVITTGDARLEMFLPDTVALTTGELTVKPRPHKSGSTGNREDVRYREYNKPTLSSVTFAKTSPGICTDVLKMCAAGGVTLQPKSVVEVLHPCIRVISKSSFQLTLLLLLRRGKLAWPEAKHCEHIQ